MPNKRLREYAALLIEKRERDKALKETNATLRELEPKVLQEMIDGQVSKQTLTVAGEKMTLYIHKMIRPRAKLDPETGEPDKEAVTKALKRCGCSFLVSEGYNGQSLGAYVRERMAEEGRKLQPSLEAVLDLNETVSVRGMRSSATGESTTAKIKRTQRK